MNKEREIIKIEDREEACDIAFGDHPDFELIKDDIIDNTRWSILHDVVVKRKKDGKFFGSGYSVGATESQDQCPYEDDERVFREVFPVEKTVIVYE